MADTTLIKFLFREEWTPLKEVLAAAPGEYGPIHEITDDKQLGKIMVEEQPTLIIASVKSKEDIAKIISFLKANKKLIKNNSIKFSAVNFTGNSQVESALMKIGCQEVLDQYIKGKPLKYKLDFWKKALTSGPKNGGSDAKLSVKDKAQEAADAAAKPEGVKWEDGLKCVDDMWLIRSTDHAKKILGKWLMKFMGPSPFVGQWSEATPGKKGVWRFVFKDAIRASFHKTEGHWYFVGDQKPEFVWKENLWMITGQQFQLVFQNGEEKAIRFQATQPLLLVCKNSSIAKAKENAIIETFDQEVMIKKGIITDKASLVDADNQLGGHLRGDTEGEAPIDGGPMEGKSSTDDLGGSLAGNVSEQEAGDKGPYSGKSSTDHLDGETDGNAGLDNVGPTKYKGKMAFEKTDRKSEYGGEGGTDDLGPGHYSNETEGGVSQQKDKENKLSKDPVRDGQLGGELGTEDLGPAHYSNQAKPEAAKADKKHQLTKDPVRSGELAGEGDSKTGSAPLAGKAGTDDLGSDHYKKPDNVTPQERLKELQEKKRAQDVAAQQGEDAPQGELPEGSVGPDGKLIPILREKAKRPEASKLDFTPEAEQIEGEEDFDRPAVTATATVKAYMRKEGSSAQITAQVDDFFDDQVIVLTAPGKFKAQDKVELFVSFDYQNKIKKVEVKGVCVEANNDGEESVYITIQLAEWEVKIFEQFMDLYRTRQEHVSEFIKQAKGL